MPGADGIQVLHTITAVESQRAVWIAGAGCLRHEVFGEEYNQQHMCRIAASVNGRSDVPVAVWLVPESDGVAVWGMGSKVGYLPLGLATVWHPVLRGLNVRYNLPVACQATLDAPSASNNGVWSMVVWLPAVQVAAPPTAPVHSVPPAAAPPTAPVHSAPPAAIPAPAPPRYDPESIRAEVNTRNQAEISTLRAELDRTKQELEVAMTQARAAALPADELAQIRKELQRVGSEIEVRRSELRSVEEALEIQSFGF